MTPIRRSLISEIARATVRAGSANAGGEKRAFRLAVRDPALGPDPARPSSTLQSTYRSNRVPPRSRCPGARPLPRLSSRSGCTPRRMARCPPRVVPGAGRPRPSWSGPRAAESRFVSCHRSPHRQTGKPSAAISPPFLASSVSVIRVDPTTPPDASVRLASSPTLTWGGGAPRADVSGVWGRVRINEPRRFSGPRKPGADGQCRRGAPHGSREPFGHVTDR